MDTVVHLGYPKTGSSLLQLRLFSAHPEIHYPGLRAGNAGFDRLLRREVIGTDSLAYDGPRVARELAPYLRPEGPGASAKRVCVVSAQGLSTTVQADRGLVLARVRELFGEARILVCIRRQPDFVASTYHELRKRGPWRLVAPFPTPGPRRRPLSLAGWFEHRMGMDPFLPFVARLDYWPLLRAYADAFGAERMLVLPYEDLAADATAFLERVCRFIGVAACDLARNAGSTVVNPRRTAGQERIEGLHRDHPRLARLAAALPAPARAGARRVLAACARKEQQVLRDDQLEWIRHHCGPGNRRVAETFGIDLQGLGYPW